MKKFDYRTELRKHLKSFFNKTQSYSESYEYYTKSLNDNLFAPMSDTHKKMFSNGSGNELLDKIVPAKAKAIDSSSVLSYNFLSWIDEEHPLEIDGIEYNKVFFEVQLYTLVNSNSPSNMDVVLISKDGKSALCIESKFTEYFENDKTELPVCYCKESSYFKDNKLNDDLFSLASSFKTKDNSYNYGIKQNVCHLFGISNFLNSEKARNKFWNKYGGKKEYQCFKSIERMVLLNLIFKPKGETATLYEKYTKELMAFRDKLPTSINELTYSSYVMNYKKLFNLVENSLGRDNKRCVYLRDRYMEFHE